MVRYVFSPSLLSKRRKTTTQHEEFVDDVKAIFIPKKIFFPPFSALSLGRNLLVVLNIHRTKSEDELT